MPPRSESSVPPNRAIQCNLWISAWRRQPARKRGNKSRPPFPLMSPIISPENLPRRGHGVASSVRSESWKRIWSTPSCWRWATPDACRAPVFPVSSNVQRIKNRQVPTCSGDFEPGGAPGRKESRRSLATRWLLQENVQVIERSIHLTSSAGVGSFLRRTHYPLAAAFDSQDRRSSQRWHKHDGLKVEGISGFVRTVLPRKYGLQSKPKTLPGRNAPAYDTEEVLDSSRGAKSS